MALKHRAKRLERTLGMDKLLVVCGADGEPERCVHGRPYTEIPPNFTGQVTRIMLPPDWKALGEALDRRRPRSCHCEKDQHDPRT